MTPIEVAIRQILDEHAQLAVDSQTLGADTDLYQSGMTSHATVNVMLALEEVFDIEFPDTMLRKSTFETVAALIEALRELGATTPAS